MYNDEFSEQASKSEGEREKECDKDKNNLKCVRSLTIFGISKNSMGFAIRAGISLINCNYNT